MTKPLNILFVTRRFPPSTGGMELYAHDLYMALSKQANVRLLSWGGVNIFLPLVLPYFFIRSCWILVTQDIDIIHMQDGVLSVMGRVLKLLFNKPTTTVIHGLDITFNKYGYQKIVPPSLRALDHVFCISNAARDQVLERDIETDKTSFMPIGISDSIYSGKKQQSRQYIYKKLGLKDQKPHIILSVGRLVKRKGVEWFSANVMNDILKQFPNTVFVVTGDGDYRTSIEETIKKKKLGSNVMLLGRVDEEFRNNLYNGADLFVMPNIQVEGDMEGFGLVLLEASLCKLPVVATGIEGIKDAIQDKKNGMLVKSKDKKAFLNQVARFLSDPKLSKEFGNKSREFTLKEYDWTIIADRYITVYKSLMVKGK